MPVDEGIPPLIILYVNDRRCQIQDLLKTKDIFILLHGSFFPRNDALVIAFSIPTFSNMQICRANHCWQVHRVCDLSVLLG
jgi:hypothetical protein